MSPSRLQAELETAARRLGFEVRYERGDFRGGWYRLEDRKYVLINKNLPLEHQNAALARTLGQLDLSTVALLPQVRAFIQTFQE